MVYIWILIMLMFTLLVEDRDTLQSLWSIVDQESQL